MLEKVGKDIEDNVPEWVVEKSESGFLNNKASPSNKPSWLRETSSPVNNNNIDNNSNNNGQLSNTKKLDKNKSTTVNNNEFDEDCCCIPLDPIQWWFWMFHASCFTAGIGCLIANIYTFTSSSINIKDIILHTYGTIFSVGIIAIEGEMKFVRIYIRALNLWFIRGLFYIFCGLITCTIVTPGNTSLAIWPISVVSFILSILGFIYCIMGLLCIKSRLSQTQNQYVEIPENI